MCCRLGIYRNPTKVGEMGEVGEVLTRSLLCLQIINSSNLEHRFLSWSNGDKHALILNKRKEGNV